MRHSFISWDCSFRNFFHLADALSSQDYDLSKVELIFVEQRTREYADAYNHEFGLSSLNDRRKEFSDSFFRPVYLNDAPTTKYHLGRTLNLGLARARGEIVTIMDGDMLLPPDFIKELDRFHDDGPVVLNVERKMCPRPVGVSPENWMQGSFEYDACLRTCRNRDHIPDYVTNKGPMISAPAEAFKQVAGYDEHLVFATGLSRAGQDTNARLELATGRKSRVLSRVAVHPYHPQGFSRKTLDAVRLLHLQASIIKRSRSKNWHDWRDRSQWLDGVESANRQLINRVHNKDYSRGLSGRLQRSVFLGRAYKLWAMASERFRPQGFHRFHPV